MHKYKLFHANPKLATESSFVKKAISQLKGLEGYIGFQLRVHVYGGKRIEYVILYFDNGKPSLVMLADDYFDHVSGKVLNAITGGYQITRELNPELINKYPTLTRYYQELRYAEHQKVRLREVLKKKLKFPRYKSNPNIDPTDTDRLFHPPTTNSNEIGRVNNAQQKSLTRNSCLDTPNLSTGNSLSRVLGSTFDVLDVIGSVDQGIRSYNDALNCGASQNLAATEGVVMGGGCLLPSLVPSAAAVPIGITFGSLANTANVINHNRQFPGSLYIGDEVTINGQKRSGIWYWPKEAGGDGRVMIEIGGELHPLRENIKNGDGLVESYRQWWGNNGYNLYYYYGEGTEAIVRTYLPPPDHF
jgi:hypothetical protein